MEEQRAVQEQRKRRVEVVAKGREQREEVGLNRIDNLKPGLTRASTGAR
jgi:hypothetical protein